MIDSPPADTGALTEAEYRQAVELLGRKPNELELAMFGAMWSEHCCYKSSRRLLKRLPKEAPQVMVRAGEENAGVVDVGDGLAVAMKIESHNHPSAIEPYQGAATGVGGIVRDIFTMGARPVALLNSLRFGFPDEPRSRYLLSRVVAGIGDYGNCLGIPTVGGELYFDHSYRGNPLVNAMCVGLLRHEQLVRGAASGRDNVFLLLGNATGRDGINGATFASVTLDSDSIERRPAVQVGSPFLEKLLIEACLELLDRRLLVALQDLGAAGLTSSSVEAAHRGHGGVEIEVSAVTRSEDGMTPLEVMLSESQERMLAVVRPENVAAVRQVLERWGLHSDVIGRVIDPAVVRILEHGRLCGEVPVDALTECAPEYDWPARPVAVAPTAPLPSEPLRLLAHPNVASRRWVFQQYDQTVQAATVAADEADAALVLLPGGRRAIALCTDGNARCDDPYLAGALAVAEAARNVSCTGATPWALTNCLNFGSPERPEGAWQLAQAIAGIADAAEALGVPVISGNVSLYNEVESEEATDDRRQATGEGRGQREEEAGSALSTQHAALRVAIRPTPVVGMLGVLEDVEHRCGIGFKREGDVVALLGPVAGALDLGVEAQVQASCREAIGRGLLHSAHDCSDGGLFVALAECCIRSGLGANITAELDYLDESPSRIVLSLAAERLAELAGTPLTVLGTVGGAKLEIHGLGSWTVDEMRQAWEHGLEDWLK
ncbi:MAG: phosphoribosylformylglycinamidine synthase subunit PurL [Chloroflexota bacterium]|nr:phosphoribosylformylglycinamidine synthase subunit PurL [Chloroflexota bacterium]